MLSNMAKGKSKELVKVGKNGWKEFKSRFHFVGKVKPVQKQVDGGAWESVPYYEEKLTQSKKPRRVAHFQLETAKGNNLKCEVAGMEQEFAYPYSMTHRNSTKVKWADRLDKTKFPDDTYHIINGTDWDRAEAIGKELKNDIWVEVRGTYDFSTFKPEGEERERTIIKRNIEQFKVIEDSAEITLGRDNKIIYVTNFDSEDFIEVNHFTMQVGIKSTYQDEESKDTKVNGVFLASGKDQSTPYDVELKVLYKEPEGDAKKSLADAFASLNRLDFIEVSGIDNNRLTGTWVDVVESLDDDDPFNEVSDSERETRQEWVTTGDKKGLEVTGYTSGTIARGFLTEAEIAGKSENDPFNDSEDDDSLPFEEDEDSLPF